MIDTDREALEIAIERALVAAHQYHTMSDLEVQIVAEMIAAEILGGD